jgi:hypothetical protein
MHEFKKKNQSTRAPPDIITLIFYSRTCTCIYKHKLDLIVAKSIYNSTIQQAYWRLASLLHVGLRVAP